MSKLLVHTSEGSFDWHPHANTVLKTVTNRYSGFGAMPSAIYDMTEKGNNGSAPHAGPSNYSAPITEARHPANRPSPARGLPKTFELPIRSQSFPNQQKPSFSANCDTLLDLLRAAEPEMYSSQVENVATLITEEWWSTEGVLADTRHSSGWYHGMLASQGLLRLLYLHGQGAFPYLPSDLLKVKIPVTLFQILLRILESQREDGSWGVDNGGEDTAHAILALANLASLPYVALIQDQIFEVVARGRERLSNLKALEDMHVTSAGFTRATRTGYGTGRVCNPHVLSAMHVRVPLYEPAAVSSGAPLIAVDKINHFSEFYSTLRVLKNYPMWRIKGWLIEAYLYLPELSRVRFEVFDRSEVEENYFEYLPFFWTASSSVVGASMSAHNILNRSVLAMLNSQVVDFFNAMVIKHGFDAISSVRRSVGVIFTDLEDEVPNLPPSGGNGVLNGAMNLTPGATQGISDHALSSFSEMIHDRLSHFVNFILSYPGIQRASENDKNQLRIDVREFLLANAAQYEDNLRLQLQESPDIPPAPPSPYFKWVRSIAADHLSFKYFMSFNTCLLGHGANRDARDPLADYWKTAELKHIATDCVTHISAVSRIYNDFGYLRRNLHVAFFPESQVKLKCKADAQLKEDLVRVVTYERKCFQSSLSELLQMAQETFGETQAKRSHQVVRLFHTVSEIYNGIYALKGISTGK